MKIICVDDEAIIAENTADLCKEIEGVTEVQYFTFASDALDWMDENKADIAILDIDMPEINGLQLAAKIREKCVDTSIIFLTGFSEYAVEAFKMHASGYLMKPVNKADLEKEIGYASAAKPEVKESHVRVQTFGGFDVFVDGNLVSFKQAKCKELVAVLIDKMGSSMTRAEVAAVLWEDRMYDRALQKQFDTIIRQMRDSLKAVGIDDIFEMKSGALRINPDKVSCDLFNFMKGDIDAINAYRGEYMNAYSWACETEGYLYDKMENME